jgi:hypothetical protein
LALFLCFSNSLWGFRTPCAFCFCCCCCCCCCCC